MFMCILKARYDTQLLNNYNVNYTSWIEQKWLCIINDVTVMMLHQTSFRGSIIVFLSTYKFLGNNKIIVIFLTK